MNIIKFAALSMFLSCAAIGMAQEAPTSPATSLGDIIFHIESALIEISKSDVSAAQVHVKAARAAADKIAGNEAIVKEANALLDQGQIQAKLGDIKSASEALTQALALYRSM